MCTGERICKICDASPRLGWREIGEVEERKTSRDSLAAAERATIRLKEAANAYAAHAALDSTP